MNLLIVTVGLPRSGKSTWTKWLQHPIVNPDSIRIALHGQAYVKEAEQFVWAIAHTMVRALFLAGHNTVALDATNTTKKIRDQWKSESWQTKFKVMPGHDTVENLLLTMQDCMDRAIKTEKPELVPIIQNMAAQFEFLSDDELKF